MIFFFVIVLPPNTISIIIIVEYSTISVLDYFKDTLANVGLPEAWMEWYSNCVAQIELKEMSLIKSK